MVFTFVVALELDKFKSATTSLPPASPHTCSPPTQRSCLLQPFIIPHHGYPTPTEGLEALWETAPKSHCSQIAPPENLSSYLRNWKFLYKLVKRVLSRHGVRHSLNRKLGKTPLFSLHLVELGVKVARLRPS